MTADTELFATQPSSRMIVALTAMAEEIHAVIVRLTAYLCGVAMLALITADLVSRTHDEFDLSPRPALRETVWQPVERPKPAFAAPAPDLSDKTESYQTIRHAEGGGRKDILH